MLVAILTSTAISALVLMLAFPETQTGKWIHRVVVEGPARFLMDFTWAKLGRTLLVAGAIALFALMPEMTLLMAASGLDAAVLVEVMLIVWFASVSGGIHVAWRRAGRLLSGIARIASTVLARPNRARTPRRKSRPQGKKDDLDEPGWAFA
jgi:hypothetical protein